MRYFYDTEFHEYGGGVELISIAMVAEDGREFYAVSTEFDPKQCNDFVKEHVLPQLPRADDPNTGRTCPVHFGTKRGIGSKLVDFLTADNLRPTLWAYYSDYDHVALCSCFGTMSEMPKFMPMFTLDIKQLCVMLGDPELPEQEEGKHDALEDARHVVQQFGFLQQYAMHRNLMLPGVTCRRHDWGGMRMVRRYDGQGWRPTPMLQLRNCDLFDMWEVNGDYIGRFRAATDGYVGDDGIPRVECREIPVSPLEKMGLVQDEENITVRASMQRGA